MFINEDNIRCGRCGERIYIDMKCPKGCKVKFFINDNNVHCPSCNFRKFFWEYKSDIPRQQVAFSEECRKIKGCGSLKEDFYTRFIPIFKDFGL